MIPPDTPPGPAEPCLIFAKRPRPYGGEQFAGLLAHAAGALSLPFVRISSDEEARELLGRIASRPGRGLLLDYMGDSFADRSSINAAFSRLGYTVIEAAEAVARWSDKWTLHQALAGQDLPLPFTMCWSPELLDGAARPAWTQALGDAFVMKPRRGSAGRGVSLQVRLTSDALLASLSRSGESDPLLQREVIPIQMGRRVGWLRVYSAFDAVWPCFWDPGSHATAFDPAALGTERLGAVRSLVANIRATTGYSVFSTEIALTGESASDMVVIDAANHKPFMGSQTEVGARGVPDVVVQELAGQVATAAARGERVACEGQG